MKKPGGRKDLFWVILIVGLLAASVLAWFLGRWGGALLASRNNGRTSQSAGENPYDMTAAETSADERASRIGRIGRMRAPETDAPDSGARRAEPETDAVTSPGATTTEAASPGADESGEDNLLVDDETDEQKTSAPQPTGESGADAPATTAAGAPIYRLQVGMFDSRENAMRVKTDLEQNYQIPVFIAEVALDGETKYRVQAGAFKSRENAEKMARELRIKGHHTYIWQDE